MTTALEQLQLATQEIAFDALDGAELARCDVMDRAVERFGIRHVEWFINATPQQRAHQVNGAWFANDPEKFQLYRDLEREVIG